MAFHCVVAADIGMHTASFEVAYLRHAGGRRCVEPRHAGCAPRAGLRKSVVAPRRSSYNRSLTDNLLFAIAFIKRLIFSLSICNGLPELVGVLDGVLDGVEIPMSLGALITMKRFLNSSFSPINRLRKNRSKYTDSLLMPFCMF